ncbi:MAG TPA: cytochrome P450 [Stellaceae bacterium]|jgi:cytochrome P450|nr:cytochrome P450 [Stellaceae bacterium]
MNTAETTSVGPVLPAPNPPAGTLGLFAMMRTIRDSSIATYPRDAYERDFLDRSFLWAHAYIVNAPEGIKHVLLDNAENYIKTRLARRLLEPGIGQGLLTSEGEAWKRHRRIMAPSFDPRSVASYAPLMVEHTEAMLAQWDLLPDGATLTADQAMMRLTLDIIAQAMFSSDTEDIANLVATGAERYQTEVRPTLFDLLPLPRWLPRLADLKHPERIFSEFDRKIDRMMAERRRTGASERHDLLARLLAARDEETGTGLSTKEIRDEIITIFMAGHETTSLALTWTLYLLSQHPVIEAKLHRELNEVLGGRAPRAEDVPQLRYARMVIDEALRLYPPAHTLSREAIDADEVSGHRIPAGATIYIVPWLVHRHRSLWEQPNRFDPERFAPERSANRPRFAYIPFGAGPRICIGAAFATTEAILILATIAQRYRLRLQPGHTVEPRGLITLRTRNGMAMVLERR